MPEDEQVELIDAHPRLGAPPAGRVVVLVRRAGLRPRCRRGRPPTPSRAPRVADELDRLNAAYEARFGFRYCVFVAGRSREALLPGMQAALAADRDAEIDAGARRRRRHRRRSLGEAPRRAIRGSRSPGISASIEPMTATVSRSSSTVDTGIDDSLALLYAVRVARGRDRRGDLLLRATSRRTRSRRTRWPSWSSPGGPTSRSPWAATVPLVRPLEITPETHGPAGHRPRRAAAAEPAVSERHAADVIIDEARRRPGEVTLVTLGPLTNLAVALEREPELPRLLRRLGVHGWRLPRPRQHDPDDRVEHPLRSGGGAAGLPRAFGRRRRRPLRWRSAWT